jgi:hypothetical protein
MDYNIHIVIIYESGPSAWHFFADQFEVSPRAQATLWTYGNMVRNSCRTAATLMRISLALVLEYGGRQVVKTVGFVAGAVQSGPFKKLGNFSKSMSDGILPEGRGVDNKVNRVAVPILYW